MKTETTIREEATELATDTSVFAARFSGPKASNLLDAANYLKDAAHRFELRSIEFATVEVILAAADIGAGTYRERAEALAKDIREKLERTEEAYYAYEEPHGYLSEAYYYG